MYLDAVLDKDLMPLYNSTPENVREWLEKNQLSESSLVCPGRTMKLITVPEYLGQK